jgi:hypothetical protein
VILGATLSMPVNYLKCMIMTGKPCLEENLSEGDAQPGKIPNYDHSISSIVMPIIGYHIYLVVLFEIFLVRYLKYEIKWFMDHIDWICMFIGLYTLNFVTPLIFVGKYDKYASGGWPFRSLFMIYFGFASSLMFSAFFCFSKLRVNQI